MADKETSLFDQPDNTPALASQFFLDLLKAVTKSEEMGRRFDAADLSGNAIEVFRRLNTPGHPVREGLILLGAGCLEEPKQ